MQSHSRGGAPPERVTGDPHQMRGLPQQMMVPPEMWQRQMLSMRGLMAAPTGGAPTAATVPRTAGVPLTTDTSTQPVPSTVSAAKAAGSADFSGARVASAAAVAAAGSHPASVGVAGAPVASGQGISASAAAAAAAVAAGGPSSVDVSAAGGAGTFQMSDSQMTTEETSESRPFPRGPPVTPYRKWFFIRKAQGGDASRLVRVVTYNCGLEMRMKKSYSKFAQMAENPRKDGLSHWHARWPHRFSLLSYELHEQTPDVLCLQEVDKFEEYSEIMAPRGYQGVFERRPCHEGFPYFVNGLATFWNTEKFRLVGRAVFMLSDFRSDADNIALCTRLEKIDAKLSRSSLKKDGSGEGTKAGKDDSYKVEDDTIIDVWNAQLHEKNEEIRLHQARALMRLIGETSNKRLHVKPVTGLESLSFGTRAGKTPASAVPPSKSATPPDVSPDLVDQFKAIWQAKVASEEEKKDSSESGIKIESSSATVDLEIEEDKKEASESVVEKDDSDVLEKHDLTEDPITITSSASKIPPSPSKPDFYGKASSPTTLARPVILCVDTGGDCVPWRTGAARRISMKSYAYLTHRSRTTMELPTRYGDTLSSLLPYKDQMLHQTLHAFFLQSAYALGFGREPNFTQFIRAYTANIFKTPNFILFTPQNFRVLNLLDIFNQEWVLSQPDTKAIPCYNYPSDHVLIGVDLEVASFKGVNSVAPKEHPAQNTQATAEHYVTPGRDPGFMAPPPGTTMMHPSMMSAPPAGYPSMPGPMGMGGPQPPHMPGVMREPPHDERGGPRGRRPDGRGFDGRGGPPFMGGQSMMRGGPPMSRGGGPPSMPGQFPIGPPPGVVAMPGVGQAPGSAPTGRPVGTASGMPSMMRMPPGIPAMGAMMPGMAPPTMARGGAPGGRY